MEIVASCCFRGSVRSTGLRRIDRCRGLRLGISRYRISIGMRANVQATIAPTSPKATMMAASSRCWSTSYGSARWATRYSGCSSRAARRSLARVRVCNGCPDDLDLAQRQKGSPMALSLPMHTIVNNTSLPGFFAATAMPDPDWWQALWPEPEKVFAALGIPSGLEVVDLCCGDGLFTVPLARMSRHVTGIDIDPRHAGDHPR
jgi:hypothetical protein